MAGDIRLPYRHFERSPQIFVIRIQVVDVRTPPNGKPVISITFGHRPFTKIDAERRSGAFINRLLETLLPARLHAASALSAPAGHLPLEGKAGDTGETCHCKPSGTAPALPSEPVKPTSPLSQIIKGRHAPQANPEV